MLHTNNKIVISIVCTIIIGCWNVFRWERINNNRHRTLLIVIYLILSLLLFQQQSTITIQTDNHHPFGVATKNNWLFPIVILWRPGTEFLVQLISYAWPLSKTSGGPLGAGYRKGMEIIVAAALWYYVRNHTVFPSPIQLMDDSKFFYNNTITSSPKSIFYWFLIILILCGLVNIVLYGWSKYYKQYQSYDVTAKTNQIQLAKLVSSSSSSSTSSLSKNNSSSSNNDIVVNSTIESQLSSFQHLKILGWAIINAGCEEITYRGYWRIEIQLLLLANTNHAYSNQQSLLSNIGQGIIFGILHYYGIPNGWIGVLLTFVYGIIMGYIADIFGGLLVPIVMHSIADYYLFAYVVRQQPNNATAATTSVVSKEKKTT